MGTFLKSFDILQRPPCTHRGHSPRCDHRFLNCTQGCFAYAEFNWSRLKFIVVFISMKVFAFISSAVAVLWLAGCAAREQISLNDEALIAHRKSAELSVSPIKPGLSPAEIIKIEHEVFIWLLSNLAGSNNTYSAVFLQADEAETSSFIKQFPNHTPPIKQLWHLDTRLGQSPLDKDTNRKALILSVDVSEPENGFVNALGRWFAGNAVAGFHTFEIKQTGGQWQIQTVK